MHPCSRCIHSSMVPVFVCGAGYLKSKQQQKKYRNSYQYFPPDGSGRIGYYSDCNSFIHKPKQKSYDTQQQHSTDHDNNDGFGQSFWGLLLDDDSTIQTVGNYRPEAREHTTDTPLFGIQTEGDSTPVQPVQPCYDYTRLQAG